MSDIKGKNWSMDEIDMLLSRTEKVSVKDNADIMKNFEKASHFTDTACAEKKGGRRAEKETVKNLFASEEDDSLKGEKPTVVFDKTAKQKVADAVKSIKDSKSTAGRKNDFEEPYSASGINSLVEDYEMPAFEEAVPKEKPNWSDGKTKVIERPGFVMKRGKADTGEGLEEAPKIFDTDEAKKNKELFKKESKNEAETESWSENQIKLYGFDSRGEDKPDEISEEEAEKTLKKNRKNKIDKFKLLGIADATESEDESDWNIEKLFAYQQSSSGSKPKSVKANNAGVEYNDVKDINRIRGTLNGLKKASFIRLLCYAGITVIMLILNIISAAGAGYDNKILLVINLILLAACIVLGLNCVNSGIIAIFKKSPDLRSAVTVASLAALVQNICLLLGSAVVDYHSFVVSGCAAAAFALNEYGEYLRHSRTCDAFVFCTGKMKKKLYSIQKIENKNERAEISGGKAQDVRYSCRAKFPSKLIEQCESNVSADKLQSLLMPVSAAASVLCGLIAGIAAKDFLYGVTAWAGAMCVCVPAFGAASIQLPMRWVNKRLNKTGGLITSQDAIEDYSKTDAIVIDSAELFDTANCKMHGFRHFNRIRVDDIMLYAAAMVIRSGGPLAEVFDQVVSKRELLPEVSSFNYEDKMGISGWINNQKVIMGNRNMMKHHNLQIDSEVDEEKYTHDGRKVIYLAIDNSLAAVLVVSYAPNKKLIPFIKRLGNDGVTIFVRNNDSNITTEMINETFGMKFRNISLISNTAGRIYKKYRNRVKDTAKSGIIHDGKAFSFMRSFTMSYTLCGTFKVENTIQLINVIAGFAAATILALFKVFSSVGMWPLLIFQIIMALASVVVARVRGIF